MVQQADAALRNRLGMQWIRALWRAGRAPSNDPFSANWPLDLTMTIEQGKVPFTSVTHGTDHDQPWVRLPTASAALYLSALALGLAIAVPGVAIALTVAKLYVQHGRGGGSPFSYVVNLEKRFGRSDSGVALKWAADVDLTAG